jgi:ATP-dependent DNA helicase RecQ
VQARAYHAGLSDAERADNQNAFARDEADVIVATVAFGMGIDKSNVRFVIHRDLPRSLEGWYQEIGRAGRDGLASDCVLMYSWVDVVAYERFLDEIEDPALRATTKEKTIRLFNLAESARCRHQSLAAYFDEQIERCGTSCDACLGRDLGALLGSTAVSTITRNTAPKIHVDAEPNAELFDKLRVLRKAIADTEQVPAYIVFSDAVLRAMAASVPVTERELLAISGVGPVKLERYGDRFLELLRTNVGDMAAE